MVIRFTGLFAAPGRVLVSPHDRGVHRHYSVEVLVRVSLSHQVSLGHQAVKTRSQVPSTAHIRSRL